MTTATHKLTISGDTRGQKETLKRRGWKWDSDSQSWSMLLVDAHAEQAALPGLEFVKRLIETTKGCLITLDGKTLWRSKTYGQTAGLPAKGDIYNCDQFGNRVAGRQIPGSDPMDRI